MAEKKKKKKVKTKARMANDPLRFIGASVEEAAPAVEKRPQGRPKTDHRVNLPSTKVGVPEGWTRQTYIIRDEMIEFLKEVSYWDRKQIKEVIDEALAAHQRRYKERLEELKKSDAKKTVAP